MIVVELEKRSTCKTFIIIDSLTFETEILNDNYKTQLYYVYSFYINYSISIMLPLVYRYAIRYMPTVTLPFAFVIGGIGYYVESRYRKGNPSYIGSILEKREERLAEEFGLGKPDCYSPLKEKNFVPKSIFERNVSPSLLDDKEK